MQEAALPGEGECLLLSSPGGACNILDPAARQRLQCAWVGAEQPRGCGGSRLLPLSLCLSDQQLLFSRGRDAGDDWEVQVQQRRVRASPPWQGSTGAVAVLHQ